jgi:hypothetical protein
MRCQEFREMLDSYLSDELLIETNHEVLHHLENCNVCRNELAARRQLRTRMRLAVKAAPGTQVNPIFARQLETNLRETALRPSIWKKMSGGAFSGSPILATAVAACLLFFVLFGANWLRRSSSPAPEINIAQQNQTNQPADSLRSTDEANAAQVIQTAWREITHLAVGDHENCALHFRLKEDPITLDEAAEKYGKFNKNLDKKVIASLRANLNEKNSGKRSDEVEFLEAHSCVFEGRRFAHIVLRRNKQVISVLVTDIDLPVDNGNSFEAKQSNPTLKAASFHVNRNAVFVISDLSETENMRIAHALLPGVQRHIKESETGV